MGAGRRVHPYFWIQCVASELPGTSHSPSPLYIREGMEWNKQITSDIIIKIVLTLRALWKGLRVPQGSPDHTWRNTALGHTPLNAPKAFRVSLGSSVLLANCFRLSHVFLACSISCSPKAPDYPLRYAIFAMLSAKHKIRIPAPDWDGWKYQDT